MSSDYYCINFSVYLLIEILVAVIGDKFPDCFSYSNIAMCS